MEEEINKLTDLQLILSFEESIKERISYKEYNNLKQELLKRLQNNGIEEYKNGLLEQIEDLYREKMSKGLDVFFDTSVDDDVSKNTSSEDVGTLAPPEPPDVLDQYDLTDFYVEVCKIISVAKNGDGNNDNNPHNLK